MRPFLLFLAAVLPLTAECGPDVFQTAQNFEHEIHGEPDARPGEWGRHGGWVWAWPIDTPPAGQRIRILSLYGDLTARWQNYPKWLRNGASTGVLIDIKTTPGPDGWGNKRGMPLGTDGSLIYRQRDIVDGDAYIEIDKSFDERNRMTVLAEDNTLYVKVFTYLDETPSYTWVHVEPTLTVTWCYDSISN